MGSDKTLKLADSVTSIKGVGKKRAELLGKMNIHTVEDLLYLFPRKYEDRRHAVTIMEAPFNQDVLLEVHVVTKQVSGNPYSKKRLLRVLVEDNTGSLELLFFNGKYLADYFKPGQALTLFGKITLNNGRRQMAHPEFHVTGDKDDIRGLFPVYPLTEGLYQGQMRSMQLAVRGTEKEIKEWLPEKIVRENNLCDPAYAIENIHFPLAERPVLESRYRLIFEDCKLDENSLAYRIYGSGMISERHRHRYEFNNAYLERMEAAGLKATGRNPDTGLVEIVEIPTHPFFIGVQFHPELKSTPEKPQPIFVKFVEAAMAYREKRK